MALDPSDIDYGLKLLKDRQARDLKFSAYYEGSFDLSFVPSEMRSALQSLLRKVHCNRCRPVVDALADRTTVVGWESSGADSKALIEKANEVWARNRMANRQNEVVKAAYQTGDAYVIVLPDPLTGKARIYPNKSHLVTVVYDAEEPDHVDYAVKCWRVDRGVDKGKWRLTTYQPDWISRYITTSKTDTYPDKFSKFVEFTEDDQPDFESAWPFGIVPVIHFGNDADTGGFGTSELSDIVGMQDALNNSIARQMIAEEFASFPQKWLVGYAPEDDPVTGQKVNPFKMGMDRLLTIEDYQAKFGQFESADMEQFIKVRNSWTLDIATVSRTPLHWFDPDRAATSGEERKVSESPFTSKVTDRHGSFGGPYAATEQLALIIEGATPESVMNLKPTWMPAESRSEQELWTVAQMKRAAGIPDEQVWKEAGYTTDEITAMVTMKDAAAKRQQEMFMQSFDRGQNVT